MTRHGTGNSELAIGDARAGITRMGRVAITVFIYGLEFGALTGRAEADQSKSVLGSSVTVTTQRKDGK